MTFVCPTDHQQSEFPNLNFEDSSENWYFPLKLLKLQTATFNFKLKLRIYKGMRDVFDCKG